MKAYVLVADHGECQQVIGVYSCPDTAKAAKKAILAKDKWQFVSIEEYKIDDTEIYNKKEIA